MAFLIRGYVGIRGILRALPLHVYDWMVMDMAIDLGGGNGALGFPGQIKDTT